MPVKKWFGVMMYVLFSMMIIACLSGIAILTTTMIG